MTAPSLERLEVAAATHDWLRMAPYALLTFISANGDVPRTRILGLLRRFGLESERSQQLGDAILEELLRAGHIFEIGNLRYGAFPPYAIQRAEDEWLILGNVISDRILANADLFEIRAAVSGEVGLERLLVVPSVNAERLLTEAHVKAFSRHALMELVPDLSTLAEPLVWDGFEPGPFARWERMNERGFWEQDTSRPDSHQGPCRGLALDANDRLLAVKNFWRHRDGWSPMTREESLLWEFKRARAAGYPRQVSYSVSLSQMEIRFRLPYAAFVALRYLSQVLVSGALIQAKAIDLHTAEEFSRRLGFVITPS